MKKIFFLFGLMLFLSQTISAKKKAEGYIIGDKDDTTKVTFLIPIDIAFGDVNFEMIQRGLQYIDADGKKKKLKPEMAKAIVFNLDGKTIKMLVCSNSEGQITAFLKGKLFFVHVYSEEGKIIVLRCYGGVSRLASRDGSLYSAGGEGYVYKKYGEIFNGRNVDVQKIFGDCPDVMTKINNKTYSVEFLDQIVTEYNRICGK